MAPFSGRPPCTEGNACAATHCWPPRRSSPPWPRQRPESSPPRPRGPRRSGDGGRVTSTHLISATGALAGSAVTTARSHPAATRLGSSQGLTVKNALQDSTGATHVRMTRTYHGLRVLGGDLVVHRAASGAYLGTSQTLTRDLTPVDDARRCSSAAALTKVDGRTAGRAEARRRRDRLDPAAGLAGHHRGTQKDGTPSRLATYVDARTGAVLRTEQQIETVDGSGQSSVRRHRAAAAHASRARRTSSRTRRAATPTRPT